VKLTIDTTARTLSLIDEEDSGAARTLPLYSPEAFTALSREWVRTGWALNYFHTFTWMGRPILQLPDDLIRFQEVFHALRPDVIIETGIFNGGSQLFHASLAETLGHGRVIGIDIEIDQGTRWSLETHHLKNRIALIQGDSAAPEIVAQVRALLQPGETVMVVLDSDHSKAHVARELEAYAPLVTPGMYLIATDGIMRDLTDVPHGAPHWTHDNPAAAAAEFLAHHPEFELAPPQWPHNRSELTPALSNTLTYWPDGWLKRK
jgi:cephalosporin hydroxylase